MTIAEDRLEELCLNESGNAVCGSDAILVFDLATGDQVYPAVDKDNPWIRSFGIPIGDSVTLTARSPQ